MFRARLKVKTSSDKLFFRNKVQLDLDGVITEVSLSRVGTTYTSDYFNVQKYARSIKALGEDLVLELLFYEGSGSVAHDSSGYGNDCSLTGPSWKTLSSGKNVLVFDGSDDYGIITLSDSLKIPSDVSIEVVVKPYGSGSWYWQGIVMPRRTGLTDPGYEVGLKDRKYPYFFCKGTDYVLLVHSEAFVNEFVHVVGIRAGDVFKLYINGKISLQQSKAIGDITPNYDVCIGKSINNQNYLSGELALVRIWDRALSDSEVQALYELAKTMIPELP